MQHAGLQRKPYNSSMPVERLLRQTTTPHAVYMTYSKQSNLITLQQIDTMQIRYTFVN